MGFALELVTIIASIATTDQQSNAHHVRTTKKQLNVPGCSVRTEEKVCSLNYLKLFHSHSVNNGLQVVTIPPQKAVPIKTTTKSGMFGQHNATVSPLWMPLCNKKSRQTTIASINSLKV